MDLPNPPWTNRTGTSNLHYRPFAKRHNLPLRGDTLAPILEEPEIAVSGSMKILWQVLMIKGEHPWLAYIRVAIDRYTSIGSLIDTGSTRTVITHTLAKSIWGEHYEASLKPIDSDVTGVVGYNITCLGEKRVTLVVGNRTFRHLVLVIQYGPQEMILGNDFLVTYNLSVIPEYALMKLARGIDVVKWEPRGLLVTAASDTAILPRAGLQLMRVKIHTGSRNLTGRHICISSRAFEERVRLSLTIPSVYVQIVDKNKAWVYAQNTYNPAPLYFEKHQIIGIGQLQEVPTAQARRLQRFRNMRDSESNFFRDHTNVPVYTRTIATKRFIPQKSKNVIRCITTPAFKHTRTLRMLLEKKSGIIARHQNDLGKFKNPIDLRIVEYPKTTSYNFKDPSNKQMITETLLGLEKLGVMKQGQSEFAHPVQWARVDATEDAFESEQDKLDHQGNTEIQFTIDYTQSDMALDEHIPQMVPADTVLSLIANSNCVSILVINKAHWQVPLNENTAKQGAIRVDGRTWMPTRVSAELPGAKRLLAYCLFQTIKGMHDFVLPYFDRLIIYSDGTDIHWIHLERVLDQVKTYGWKICPVRSKFIQERRVAIAGCNIELKTNQIFIDETRRDIIRNTPHPKTQQQLIQWLKMLWGYGHMIADIREVFQVLEKHLVFGKPFEWDDTSDVMLDIIKRRITEKPIKPIPDCKELVNIWGVAAEDQIWGLLSQPNSDTGELDWIAWRETNLTENQRKFRINQKEVLAMIIAMTHFDLWVLPADLSCSLDNQEIRINSLHSERLMNRLLHHMNRLQVYPHSAMTKEDLRTLNPGLDTYAKKQIEIAMRKEEDDEETDPSQEVTEGEELQ